MIDFFKKLFTFGTGTEIVKAVEPKDLVRACYRCRACGADFFSASFRKTRTIADSIVPALINRGSAENGNIQLYIGHECPDGGQGFADYIGIK
jgi:hypothetical protein